MRCDACGRAWAPSARFCGRCGQQLEPGPGGGRPGRGEGPGTDGRWSRRGIVAGIAVVLAAGALTLTAMPTLLDGTGRPQPVPGDVAVPTADPITEVVRAADRRRRPADCSDTVQELPRPVRHYGLYTGKLEWRDGRLCALVTDRDEPDPAPPRCDPPWALVCAIP